jgi:hypothetical protein
MDRGSDATPIDGDPLRALVPSRFQGHNRPCWMVQRVRSQALRLATTALVLERLPRYVRNRRLCLFCSST